MYRYRGPYNKILITTNTFMFVDYFMNLILIVWIFNLNYLLLTYKFCTSKILFIKLFFLNSIQLDKNHNKRKNAAWQLTSSMTPGVWASWKNRHSHPYFQINKRGKVVAIVLTSTWTCCWLSLKLIITNECKLLVLSINLVL